VNIVQVLEGYGQTECGAICTLQVPGDGDIGKFTVLFSVTVR